MAKELIYYHSGQRYSYRLTPKSPQVVFGGEWADVTVSSLSQALVFQLKGQDVHYDLDGQEGILESGQVLAGGRAYVRETKASILDPLDLTTITIGSEAGNHLALAGEGQLILTKTADNWRLDVLAGRPYLNNRLLQSARLDILVGAEISLGDQTIKVFPDELHVWGMSEVSPSLAKRSSSQHEFYEDYPDYHRSPRLIYRPSEDKVTLNAPRPEPNKSREGLVKLIVPPLLMITMTVVISIFQPRGLYILSTLAMTLASTIFSVTGYFKQGREYKEDLVERIETYRAYLADKAKELAGLVDTQFAGQHYHYPSINQLSRLANRYDHRIYEKTPLHFDFLHYRLGLGTVPVSYQLTYNQTERSGKRDPLEQEGYALYNRYLSVDDMPIVANLTQGPVGYIGPRTLVIEQLQLMVNQLAMFHSYHDVQFITIMPEEEKAAWDWMRFLPHASLQSMNVRGFVYNQRTHDQVLNSLNQVLKLRRSQKEDKSQRQSTLFSPHYVVLVTDEKLILDHMIMEFFREDPTELGCSLIFVQDVMSSLSENVKTIINIKDRNTGQLVMEAGQLKEIDFALDHFPEGYDKEAIVRRLAPLNHLQNLKSSIPDLVTFLELYEAQGVEDLTIAERWAQNAPYKSLAVPIGLRGKADKVYLNLHEKAHGPHGLVAGTTGSGKSEVIQSYILSLAVNFHPHDVAFLLIDYKGGGMANLFKDLPHLLGAITNLDGAQSMRALVSINAELKRRQRLFSEHDVNHINQYQKKYKLGQVPEPMPHLFLISDEFAELKANQPEFMKELVSTARIGRSLGIHLILATQKPSGVVDDQIWSNSRFKLALKVADRSDSMEMLKTPDAADITQVGRGYLQVGNNEVYELFQSAWSGADYQPDKDQQGIEDHTIYAINDLGQYDILNDDLSGLEEADQISQVPSELSAIVAGIKKLTQTMGLAQLPQPWLPPLEKRIYVEELRTENFKDLWEKTTGLVAKLGVVDLPNQQAQRELEHDFEEDGHIALFSSPGMGKSTFLQTVVMDLARQLTPEQLHVYLLDFGTNGLLPLRDLPHVADIFLADENEKLLKLANRLYDEIRSRKQLISSSSVSNLVLYERVTAKQLPRIMVVLDSYEAVRESKIMNELEAFFQYLSREGLAIGIYLVMTAGRTGTIRPQMLSNFKIRIALKLNEISEISTIVGRTQLTIDEIPGRGLIQIDQAESIQFALPFMSPTDIGIIEGLQNEAKLMDKLWVGDTPSPIPMMPERLTEAQFKGDKSIKVGVDNGYLPLGLDFEHVEHIGLNLKRLQHILIFGEKQVQVYHVLKHLLGCSLPLLDNIQISLFDIMTEFVGYQDKVANYVDLAGLAGIEHQLMIELEKRKQRKSTVINFYIISDLVAFLENSKISLNNFVTLYQEGPKFGMHFIFADVKTNLAKSDPIIRYLKDNLEIALIAQRLYDQTLVTHRMTSREEALKVDEIYLYQEGQVQKLKISYQE